LQFVDNVFRDCVQSPNELSPEWQVGRTWRQNKNKILWAKNFLIFINKKTTETSTHNNQLLSHLDEGTNVPFQGESKVTLGLHYLSIMP
jgi:hypothetical protein